jgi:hypothetical protein
MTTENGEDGCWKLASRKLGVLADVLDAYRMPAFGGPLRGRS